MDEKCLKEERDSGMLSETEIHGKDKQSYDKCLKEKIEKIFYNSENEVFFHRLSELEEILKYKFNRINFLAEALTHSSVIQKISSQLELLGLEQGEISEEIKCKGLKSYERLEFLGDAILGQWVAVYLYHTYPDLEEGVLTKLRSANVRNENLACVVVQHGLFHYLRFEQPDMQENIDKFIQDLENEPKQHRDHSNPPKVLADIVESIAGAVFVDSGDVTKVWEVFEPLLQPLVGPKTLEMDRIEMDPISELFKLCQRKRKEIEYKGSEKVSEKGNLLFSVNLFVDGQLVGSGENFKSKKLAKKVASRNALLNLM